MLAPRVQVLFYCYSLKLFSIVMWLPFEFNFIKSTLAFQFRNSQSKFRVGSMYFWAVISTVAFAFNIYRVLDDLRNKAYKENPEDFALNFFYMLCRWVGTWLLWFLLIKRNELVSFLNTQARMSKRIGNPI